MTQQHIFTMIRREMNTYTDIKTEHCIGIIQGVYDLV